MWQGVLILNSIQLVISFILGIFIFQILAHLLKFKLKKWKIAIKLSAMFNILKSIILLLPYFFPDSISIRIGIVIAGLLVVIVVSSHFAKQWYKLSWAKAVAIIVVCFIALFVIGFLFGGVLGNIAYELNIIGVPVL